MSVQGRSSISSKAGRSFLDRAITVALGQEVQLPDELPLLFLYLLPPKFPAASQQAVACNSVAPGAGSLAGFLPLTQPSHTSCSLLLGSVPIEKEMQAGCPSGYLFPQVLHDLFRNSGKL